MIFVLLLQAHFIAIATKKFNRYEFSGDDGNGFASNKKKYSLQMNDVDAGDVDDAFFYFYGMFMFVCLLIRFLK